MKRILFLCFIFVFIISACQKTQENQPLSQDELIKKGEYLVMVAGCNDCHSPKEFTPEGPIPDANLLLSGHPQNLKLAAIDPNSIGPGKWMLMNDHLTAHGE